MAGPQNVKHSVTTCPSNSTPRYINKGNENTCPHKYVYTNVHTSILPKSQRVETIQMFINWWTVKQIVMYPQSRLLVRKRAPITIWMNLEHLMLTKAANYKKTKYYIIPFRLRVRNRQTYRNRKYTRCLELEEIFLGREVMKMFSKLIVVMTV